MEHKNTTLRHNIWEIYVQGLKQPVIANDIIKSITNEAELGQATIKRKTAESTSQGSQYLTCSQCGVELFFQAENPFRAGHLKHKKLGQPESPNYEKQMNCQFYTINESTFLALIYNGEGPWHFKTKSRLYELLKQSSIIITKSIKVEKYLFDPDPELNARRRPDISFDDIHGNKWAFEITRHWMKTDTVVNREMFYRKLGINLVWIFSEQCITQNKTTFDYIMYGSNLSERSEFNGYIWSDLADIRSSECDEITLEVIWPEFKLTQNLGTPIEFILNSQLLSIHQLALDPTNRLPYGIETKAAYNATRVEVDHLKNSEERRLNRLGQASILLSIRKHFPSLKNDLSKTITAQQLARIDEQIMKIAQQIETNQIKLNKRAYDLISAVLERYRVQVKQARKQLALQAQNLKKQKRKSLQVNNQIRDEFYIQTKTLMKKIRIKMCHVPFDELGEIQSEYEKLSKILTQYNMSTVLYELESCLSELNKINLEHKIEVYCQDWQILNHSISLKHSYQEPLNKAVQYTLTGFHPNQEMNKAIYENATKSINSFCQQIEERLQFIFDGIQFRGLNPAEKYLLSNFAENKMIFASARFLWKIDLLYHDRPHDLERYDKLRNIFRMTNSLSRRV